MEKANDKPEGEWWWIEELEEKPQPPRPWKTESLEKFRLLKQWVRDCDPVFGWPVEARMERIRRNVMQEILDEPQWFTEETERRRTKSFKV